MKWILSSSSLAFVPPYHCLRNKRTVLNHKLSPIGFKGGEMCLSIIGRLMHISWFRGCWTVWVLADFALCVWGCVCDRVCLALSCILFINISFRAVWPFAVVCLTDSPILLPAGGDCASVIQLRLGTNKSVRPSYYWDQIQACTFYSEI